MINCCRCSTAYKLNAPWGTCPTLMLSMPMKFATINKDEQCCAVLYTTNRLNALDVAQAKDFSDICEILEHYTREDSTSKLTEVSNVIHGLVYT